MQLLRILSGTVLHISSRDAELNRSLKHAIGLKESVIRLCVRKLYILRVRRFGSPQGGGGSSTLFHNSPHVFEFQVMC